MYICVTNVDVETNIICTKEPMRTGPGLPNIKGLEIIWAEKSTWPIPLNTDGSYKIPPKYYCICNDDADTTIAGVLEVLTEQEWIQRKRDESYAVKPYPSWVWDETTLTWLSPVPYPEDSEYFEYQWDENTFSWIKLHFYPNMP